MAGRDLLPPLVRIPAGTFVMGAEDGEADERPPHPVYLDEFLIGACAVTHGEYARFVRETGYRPPGIDDLPLVVRHGGKAAIERFRALGERYAWTNGQPPPGLEKHPVTLVRWEDAAAYCRWLAERTRLPVRLPTEAEWEKAARGGLDAQPYPWGARLDPGCANYLANPSSAFNHGTCPVGTYPPNGYGLYEVVGNVWEWVADWYDAQYYARSPLRNPLGPLSGHLRVVRGGAWVVADPRQLRCSYRHKVPADTYSYSIGFRIACS